MAGREAASLTRQESLSYPRKRAALACNFCRKRKRKCDGQRPICSLCREANAECRYRETSRTTAPSLPSSDILLQRLERLEGLYRQTRPSQGGTGTESRVGCAAQDSPQSPASASGNSGQNSTLSSNVRFDSSTPGAEEASLSCPVDYEPSPTGLPKDASAPMVIPYGHTTTTGSLLQHQLSRNLLGQYPKDLFMRVELRRTLPDELSLHCPLPSSTDLPVLDRVKTDILVQQYFAAVHSQHPVLDRQDFENIYACVVDKAIEKDLNTALCMLVMALGTAAYEQPNTAARHWIPGQPYITAALSIVIDASLMSFGGDLRLPQALYLAALYFCFISRPLMAWKLAHMASTHVQLYCSEQKDRRSPSQSINPSQAVIVICWAIFVLECDTMAEYHLPRSGIEQLIEIFPLPTCGNPPEREMVAWLADLSARKLLNRVHHVMYDAVETDVFTGTPSHGNQAANAAQILRGEPQMSSELYYQLKMWYEYLPEAIRPSLEEAIDYDEVKTVLRYHASGDIILRPFFFQVCSMDTEAHVESSILHNARLCVMHCRKFLEAAGMRLERPSGSSEITAHSVLAATILLTLASHSSHLKDMVVDLVQLQTNAIASLRRWAFPDSSIEMMVSILCVMRSKSELSFWGQF